MLPQLDRATAQAYLARLGEPDVSLDLAGLTRLQQAHLRALPFHNLALLAHRYREPGLPPVELAVAGNIAGLGGTCHLLTPPFVALLQALGFDAWLAAATISQPGDHIVGVARVPEGHFVVDVGNGHPYVRPFPLDGEPLEFEAYGWRFRFEPEGPAYHLRRTLPDGQVKTVYRLTSEPRTYASFAEIIRGHHMQPGFGPFLGAIRAVRMTPWALAAVRDGVYQRFAAGIETSRPIETWEALSELLRVVFELPAALVKEALRAARGSRPELLTAARALQRAPRLVLSVAVTDRVDGVRKLLDSAVDALPARGPCEGSVGVLLLDNGRSGSAQDALGSIEADARQRSLRVTCIRARDELARLAPSQHLGLLPRHVGVPLPIGAARTLQAAVLHEHFQRATLDLPHPRDGAGPVVVWMLDDDLAFRRLRHTPMGLVDEPRVGVLNEIEKLWRDHPEISVALGRYTGDPPIPGYATFHVQARDLAGNLRELAAREPDSPWQPSTASRELPDYYYDHARSAEAHLAAVFPWNPPGPGPWTARAAFRSLCDAFADVPRGRQVTRPLTHQCEDLAPSHNRGGNALFLDLDALFPAPYPVLADEDGVVTRRADTLWAHLAAREPLLRIVQTNIDLRHGRYRGDGSSPLAGEQPELEALRGFVESQERGVVLARLLERERLGEEADADREVALRRRLLARSRDGARAALAEAREVLASPDAWWWRDPQDAAHAHGCLRSLGEVERLNEGVDALGDPTLPARLARFTRHVTEALPMWRSLWG